MLDGSITSARDDGLYVRGKSKVMLRTDAGFIASIVDSGLNLEPGKVVMVGGTQVLGPQGAAVAADATDLATALTLVNQLKARLRAHGLVA
jgi:hypothetical protein